MSDIKPAKRVSLIDMFSVPESYKPPEDPAQLSTCTEYPNQNSREYRKKPVDQSPQLLPFFEAIAINELGNFVLGTNNYRGRIWNGWGWGFESSNDVGDSNKGVYKFRTNASIINLKFVAANIFLMTDALGQVQVWSTRSDARSEGYCLFNIGSRTEHTSIVAALDTFRKKTTTLVTGSNDGCLKIWDMGKADLQGKHTFNNAHSDGITAVSSSPSAETQFVSSSRDKSLLLWDYRLPKPAIGLFEEHLHPFTSIYWTTSEENNENIFAGDEIGQLHVIDKRMPNQLQKSTEIFDHRPLNKIRVKGKNVAITGNTNVLRVINIETFKNVYSNEDATDFLRDAVWSNDAVKNSLYTIGWNAHFKEHILL